MKQGFRNIHGAYRENKSLVSPEPIILELDFSSKEFFVKENVHKNLGYFQSTFNYQQYLDCLIISEKDIDLVAKFVAFIENSTISTDSLYLEKNCQMITQFGNIVNTLQQVFIEIIYGQVQLTIRHYLICDQSLLILPTIYSKDLLTLNEELNWKFLRCYGSFNFNERQKAFLEGISKELNLMRKTEDIISNIANRKGCSHGQMKFAYRELRRKMRVMGVVKRCVFIEDVYDYYYHLGFISD